MNPTQRRNAANAVNRSNQAARAAAMRHRMRNPREAAMGFDFGSDFGAAIAKTGGVWDKIKKFFGFKSKVSAATIAAAPVSFAAPSPSMPAPQALPLGQDGLPANQYTPDGSVPINYAAPEPEKLPVDHVMALEAVPDQLIAQMNAHAVSLPAKVAALQADPGNQKKEMAVRASALRQQGQAMLLGISSMPAAIQPGARANAQAMIAQAVGIEDAMGRMA